MMDVSAAQGRLVFDEGAGAAESDITADTAIETEGASALPMHGDGEGDAAHVVSREDVHAMHAPAPIASGKALALSDFSAPSVTAGERFLRMAYRMGVPGHTLAAPFRKKGKLRLLATVESPLAGERVGGMALRAGHFLIHGVKAPVAQVDFGPGAQLTPPFKRVVHGFTWLRDLDSCAPREQCLATSDRVLGEWLAANPAPSKGAAWDVGHAGHRLLNWLVHAPLTLGGQDKAMRSKVLANIDETARWLDRTVTKAEHRLDEVAGWCGIVAAGLLLPEGKPRRLFGEAGLIRALGELVGEDGGVLSRSPIDQMEALGLLVQLSACYHALRKDVPDALAAMQQMLVPPLLALLHDDGSLGSWQGATPVSADRIAALVEASGVRTRPMKESRHWGYQRVAAGSSVLQMDAAPPPLARHTKYGCASTLALEFSRAGQRIFVNCGGAHAAGGQVPVRIEQGLRATAAHSTLVLGDSNSTAVLIRGKLGAGVEEVEVDRRAIDLKAKDSSAAATRLEASHDGYVNRFGLVHQRICILRDDGTELRGEDLLVPRGKKGKRGKVPFAIRFHLGPDIEVKIGDGGRNAGLAMPDGTYWQFASGAGDVQLEESLWVDADGRPRPVQQLVIEGMVSRGGGTFSWLLKKMG